jgi:hypothetical protein
MLYTIGEKMKNINKLEREFKADPYGFAEEKLKIVSPDDYQLRAIKEAFNLFAEALNFDELADIDKTELIDNVLSIWFEDLVDWLKFKNSSNFVDMVLEQDLVNKEWNIFNVLRSAQYLELQQIYCGINDLLE